VTWIIFKGSSSRPLKTFHLKSAAKKWASRYVSRQRTFTRVVLAQEDHRDGRIYDRMYYDLDEGWRRV
jgi:hypothetical protein